MEIILFVLSILMVVFKLIGFNDLFKRDVTKELTLSKDRLSNVLNNLESEHGIGISGEKIVQLCLFIILFVNSMFYLISALTLRTLVSIVSSLILATYCWILAIKTNKFINSKEISKKRTIWDDIFFIADSIYIIYVLVVLVF